MRSTSRKINQESKSRSVEEIRIVRHAQYGEVLSEEELGGVTKAKKGVCLSVTFLIESKKIGSESGQLYLI